MARRKGPTPRRRDPVTEVAETFAHLESADQGKAIGAMLVRGSGGVSSWGINDLVPIPLPSGPYVVKGDADGDPVLPD